MRWLVRLALALLLAGCSHPNYVDQGAGQSAGWIGQDVTFQVFDAFNAVPPHCIAVLPLTAADPEQGKIVRQSLLAHLSVQSRRAVRPERVDYVAAQTKGDLAELGRAIHCDALLWGRVTEYGSHFWLLYSRVAVGVDLELVRAADGAVLWQGQHVAVSHGGAVPLDLVGVAMGVADAVGNVANDEQELRLTDDVARRLVSTLPPGPDLPQDDPPGSFAVAATSVPDSLAVAEQALAAGDQGRALAVVQAELQQGRDHGGAAWFLKGRLLLLDHDYTGAEAALMLAMATGGRQAVYLNALGVAATGRGQVDRAMAAYDMALAVDRGDAFAWYNLAVLYSGQQRWQLAADHFYGAGLAYLKIKDFARTERAVADLRRLGSRHVPVQDKIIFLTQSLNDLKPRKS